MRKLIVATTLVALPLFLGWAQNDQKITWLDRKELKCLVDNVYHEARGEPLAGQIAVARVTLNRVGTWASTVCEVVYQRHQFSWTSKRTTPIKDQVAYYTAWHAAWMSRDYPLVATHYHAIKVSPKWAKSFNKVTQINNHIFYE
jgi:spore germination cell wall hydrolase CwlJ-like protein